MLQSQTNIRPILSGLTSICTELDCGNCGEKSIATMFGAFSSVTCPHCSERYNVTAGININLNKEIIEIN